MASIPGETERSGTAVGDSLRRIADDPRVHAMRLSGAAALLLDLTPAGLVTLLDYARRQGAKDARQGMEPL